MSKHECPYGGCIKLIDCGDVGTHAIYCGDEGHICKRCEEDRADARIGPIQMLLERIANAIEGVEVRLRP